MGRGSSVPAQFQADISVLRITATLAVVFTHTCGVLLAHPDLFEMSRVQYCFFSIVDYSLYWHVPVFFMISGAMLLRDERKITPSLCIKKYALRLLLALAVFGIPYALIELVITKKAFQTAMLVEAVVNTASGDSWNHLWYLYSLIGIYLLLPVFKRYTEIASRTEQKYILMVLFCFSCCLPFINSLLGSHIAFSVPMPYSVFYFLLGKYLSDELPRVLRNRRICTAGPVLLFIIISLAYIFFPEKASPFHNYTSPLIAAAACMVFSLLRGASIPVRRQNLLWHLDRLCFGVYLIHPLFIQFMYRFLSISPLSFQLWPLMTIAFFLLFSILSFFSTQLMYYIPFFRKHVL